MRGWVFASPTANISVTIQNQPWVAINLEVEGEDPDWVSSATAPLHATLTGRESRIVKFFRNNWVAGVFGILVWSMFIPPTAAIVEKFRMDRLFAIPLSILPLAVVNAIYGRLTKPVIITSSEPSGLREFGKVVFTAVVSYLIKLGLDVLSSLADRAFP